MQPAEDGRLLNSDADSDLIGLIEPLLRIALDAGAAIIEHYAAAEPVNVHSKSDGSPLTAADLAAHRIIESGLNALKPNWPVLSEESDGVDLSQTAHWQRYWLVDPLDGTREFIKRTGDFTVNIALIDNGRPIIGVVYAPVTRQCFWALAGGGAWCRDDNGERQIHTRAWSGHHLDVVVSRSHASPVIASWLESLPWPTATVPVGSSLKLCILAQGRADIYPRLGNTSLWDIGAAECVLVEAGGFISNLHGRPLQYQPAQGLLNPFFIACADTAIPDDIYLHTARQLVRPSDNSNSTST
ncbi:MAG: 3'(2'),5'-bisphosphate nucleotidase CysQ [Gammaproteobacteria bacterium]|nr:3'(2'),5'-bisphosphate nucleotidase CysQ [Gammaproteobacteria bacterium]